MKTIRISSYLALALVSSVSAYPSILAHLEAEKGAKAGKKAKRQVSDVVPPPFDAASQYISNQGEYAFVAPGDGDQRGPCPGLNAMANHNYLPHNGVATIQQFIDSTNLVFGMGLDLAGFLSVYGAVADGDGTQWSIGGPTPNVGSIAGVTGDAEGISGSHNKYEADVSPVKGDLYEYGNDYLNQASQFQALYDAGQPANSYDLDVLTNFRAVRFQQSIDNNPYFFNGPFSGVAVQPAAYTFIYRFMANKSEEYPEGLLTGDVLKSFYSITGDSGSFVYTPGWEAIPDNWYTRNVADQYTIPFFQTDLTAAALEYPQFLDVGGNTGTTNSFTGVDIDDLTGGVFNGASLAEGNNALCFAFQAGVQALPDFLSGLLTGNAALAPLNTALASFVSEYGCPTLDNIDYDQFSGYPGYTNEDTATGTYRSRRRS